MNYISIYSIEKILSTSLGPKGLDKLINRQYKVYNDEGDLEYRNEIIITNDGFTILKNIDIKDPILDILKNLSNSIDSKVGDGTTSGIILACQLIRNGQMLLTMNYHPNLVIKGYQLSMNKCKEVLDANALDFSVMENGDTKILDKIISTTLSSKILSNYLHSFTRICKDILSSLQKIPNRKHHCNYINYFKFLGGSISDTKLLKGTLYKVNSANSNWGIITHLNKNILSSEIQCKVISNCPLDFSDLLSKDLNKMVTMGRDYSQTFFNDKSQLEQTRITDYIKSIRNQEDSQPGYIIILSSCTSVSIQIQKMLSDNGIVIVYSLSEDKLLKCLDQSIVTLKQVEYNNEIYLQLEKKELDECISLILRGPTVYTIDEIQRSLNDAISILSLSTGSDKCKIISGGGSIEFELVLALEKYTQDLLKESIQNSKLCRVIKMFSQSLESIPKLLISNAGYDHVNLLDNIYSLHRKSTLEYRHYAIDLTSGLPTNMLDHGVIEILNSKKLSLQMIIDTVFSA
ncbi:hypothetical protein DLAC_11119 [Tieghemostelium lacteum]|uniref:Uncharacterized protein n=1 Tax=Tieghemostelium lacteum TaxID=361077 RepID=A0A151Z3A0_TIELA|nr:hypothetical protein DLAC_11119 [Tieghemostelium lacteum]|eukprot:KYQ88418.1 hypothetical protein DLAC_11119 [Tieghemostelium lacteum]